jgi:UDP-glucose 4-epimerase
VPNCHFILLSSAAVYGNPKILPVTEDTPLKPISPYGYHKIICEQLVEEYHLLHGIPSAVIRIFSAYGGGLRKQVVYDLLQKFADPNNTEVEILGTGEETRDFIHALDVAKIVELIADKEACGTFNAASGHETSMRELADLISSCFTSSKKITYNGIRRQGDPVNWRANISRLSSIGFKPSLSLKEGIADSHKWYMLEARRNK